MKPPRFELVVFDVAGTTVLEGDIVIEAMDAALMAGGVTVERTATRSLMGIPKRMAIAQLLRLGSDVSDSVDGRVDRIHDDFLQRLRAEYLYNPAVREADGASDTFAELRALGIKVALDTGFDRPTLDLLLLRLGWRVPDAFDCTVSSDEVVQGRPSPGLIRRAMQLTGVGDARLVVKVGDTPSDVQSGRAAGCGLVVGVSYGTHTRQELLSHQPAAVIDDLRELLPDGHRLMNGFGVHVVDDAVVGAGMVGLAHAYVLASRGRRVVVLERHPRARGASVRNFGMLWPIGQPAGPLHTTALRSLDVLGNVLAAAGLWHDRIGSLHVAYADDEASVLEEFAAEALDSGFVCDLLEPPDACRRSPQLRRAGLKRALFSPHEICIDPRVTVREMPAWLAAAHQVQFEFGMQVTACDPPYLVAGVRRWQAERIWICSGDDLQTLFPDVLQQQGLVSCKLQMMRSAPLASRIGPMLAGGLTLLHYRSFESCPSRPALQSRIDRELAEYRRYGIHVMAAQHTDGALVIGDSHEYGDGIEPFDNPCIDELVLKYLAGFLDTSITVASRWHGVYVKHPTDPWVCVTPVDGVVAITGLGGHGMTMAFGLAEQLVQQFTD